jgi:Fic family protein
MNQGISRGLARELKNKAKLLESSFNSTKALKFKELELRAIKKNAQIHSYRIEHRGESIPFSVPRNNGKREIKQGINHITDAFQWGRKNFNSYDFDESFIRRIAARITPELYDNAEIAQYRTKGTAIVGASVTPPYPYKLINYEIPWFENSFKEQLKCPNLINKIESAIFAHLHIARMHPFEDGNGRTSRAVQDITLEHYGVPLPVIEAGERMTYYKILDRAVDEWKDKSTRDSDLSEGEKLFYDFIAGKINMSLDKILYPSQH